MTDIDRQTDIDSLTKSLRKQQLVLVHYSITSPQHCEGQVVQR